MKMILLTEGETMSRLFDLDWQLLADSCLMIIAIFVLFLALSYFLFNPARKFLNDRKEKIRGELEEAKTSQEKAAELKEQYEAKLKDIDKEAEDILSDARRRAGKKCGASGAFREGTEERTAGGHPGSCRFLNMTRSASNPLCGSDRCICDTWRSVRGSAVGLPPGSS